MGPELDLHGVVGAARGAARGVVRGGGDDRGNGMKVSLVVVKSDGSRRDFPLVKDRVMIGRTNHCDLRVPMPSVSRKHCEISIEGDQVRLRDAGSSNGTFHNDKRVMEAVLQPGDRIGVGPVVFAVLIDGQPTDLALPPVIRDDAPLARENRPHPKPLPKPLVHDGDVDMNGEIEADAHSPTTDYDEPPAMATASSSPVADNATVYKRPMPVPQPKKPN